MALMKLIVLLVVMGSASMAFAKKGHADVNIVNSISWESPLQVHCRNRHKHDALPDTTVQYKQRVGFGFQPNPWGTTRYTCEFKWDRFWQEFPVWVDTFFLSFFETRPCTHCVWTVTVNGFYREEAGKGNGQEFLYYWKT